MFYDRGEGSHVWDVDGNEFIDYVLARGVTGRSKIFRFEGHYHGWFNSVFWNFAPPPSSVPTSKDGS